jgi:hypothetical protein
MQLATAYFYLTAYELPVQGLISKQLMYKAVQENNFPSWYGKIFIDELYPEGTNDATFTSFLGNFVSARAFKSKTETRFISFDDFKELLDSKFIPGRFNEYAEKTYIPTKEEAEAASRKIEKELTNENFFGNYNNLIFM